MGKKGGKANKGKNAAKAVDAVKVSQPDNEKDAPAVEEPVVLEKNISDPVLDSFAVDVPQFQRKSSTNSNNSKKNKKKGKSKQKLAAKEDANENEKLDQCRSAEVEDGGNDEVGDEARESNVLEAPRKGDNVEEEEKPSEEIVSSEPAENVQKTETPVAVEQQKPVEEQQVLEAKVEAVIHVDVSVEKTVNEESTDKVLRDSATAQPKAQRSSSKKAKKKQQGYEAVVLSGESPEPMGSILSLSPAADDEFKPVVNKKREKSKDRSEKKSPQADLSQEKSSIKSGQSAVVVEHHQQKEGLVHSGRKSDHVMNDAQQLVPEKSNLRQNSPGKQISQAKNLDNAPPCDANPAKAIIDIPDEPSNSTGGADAGPRTKLLEHRRKDSSDDIYPKKKSGFFCWC